MDQSVEPIIATLKDEFGETDIKRLFTKVYDYYFIPRNNKTRALAETIVTEAVRGYETENTLPQWIMPALANKRRNVTTSFEESGPNLASSIEKVLDSNSSFVSTLSDRYTTWANGIPILWRLVFKEVYGEYPRNKPETALHYADGATDDRWEHLLNSKNSAGGMTGYHYLIEALKQRGATP